MIGSLRAPLPADPPLSESCGFSSVLTLTPSAAPAVGLLWKLLRTQEQSPGQGVGGLST